MDMVEVRIMAAESMRNRVWLSLRIDAYVCRKRASEKNDKLPKLSGKQRSKHKE